MPASQKGGIGDQVDKNHFTSQRVQVSVAMSMRATCDCIAALICRGPEQGKDGLSPLTNRAYPCFGRPFAGKQGVREATWLFCCPVCSARCVCIGYGRRFLNGTQQWVVNHRRVDCILIYLIYRELGRAGWWRRAIYTDIGTYWRRVQATMVHVLHRLTGPQASNASYLARAYAASGQSRSDRLLESRNISGYQSGQLTRHKWCSRQVEIATIGCNQWSKHD